MLQDQVGLRIGYTRPLPVKTRTPIETAELLKKINQDLLTENQAFKKINKQVLSMNEELIILVKSLQNF